MPLPTRPDIRFWFQGKIVSLTGVSPQRTVLKWLREDRGLVGTKEGCGEGDCGACTVVVGSLDPGAPAGLRLRAVNACLLFLPALDGKALFTIEDVASGPDLHPVQRALVEGHGSQCGFCTPGFVMSLWADYEERTTPPDRNDTLKTLSGNLCRCTGYRPIVDAAQMAWEYPQVKIDRGPAASALKAVAKEGTLSYSDGAQRWEAPQTVDALAALVAAQPEARIVAGATDVGLWVTKGLKNLGDMVSVAAVSELRSVKDDKGTLVLGAALPLTDAFAAINQRIPSLTEFFGRFASTPVRNAGTIGGNVANGSPIGDSMPVLLALGASVVLRQDSARREIPLDQYFLGYQKTARRPGEVLVEIRIPPLLPDTEVRAWKVSKRRDQDISAVCGAFVLTQGRGGVVTNVKVAFGGMAAIPARAPKTEAVIEGTTFDQTVLGAARTTLGTEYTPLTDGRASAEYRKVVAQNLLTRLWEDLKVPEAQR